MGGSIRELQIWEKMEACRPGHDDLDNPELAGLAAEIAVRRDLENRFARLQRLDGALADAIQEVPVPDGLAGRLMAALPLAGEPAAFAHRHVRPWWFAAALAVAALVLVLVSIWQSARSVPWTATAVLEEAVALFSNGGQEAGRPISDSSPPHALPLSPAVHAWPQASWHSISGFLDRNGVAYDLTSGRGTRATLYVVKRTVAGLPDEPPSRPALGTGNCTAAAWQEGSLLYVLVVQGDATAYAEFLDLPRGPVT